jgi:alpha-amylase
VDAAINHMTNYPSPGVGSNGTAYSRYDYPGLYTSADFHPPCTVNNYQDAADVQDCELLSLPDLNTGKRAVREKIAAYLVMVARAGVAGFRIDAAKHIQQVELDSIFRNVDSTMAAEGRTLPYYFLEVIGGAGEALSPRDASWADSTSRSSIPTVRRGASSPKWRSSWIRRTPSHCTSGRTPPSPSTSTRLP